MNLKVWSNRREPVRLFETGLNTITTNFCTDERHRKCLALGKCQAQEPRCEWDKCKMAGMSTHRYFNITTEGGGLGATIKISKDRDAKVVAALAKFLNQCRPYVLTWEPVKNTVQPRKKPCLPRKKRCRPSKK